MVPRQTQCRLVALLSDSALSAVQLKERFVKFMYKALKYKNPVARYAAKIACLNPITVSGRNWLDYVTSHNGVSMVDMNVIKKRLIIIWMLWMYIKNGMTQ